MCVIDFWMLGVYGRVAYLYTTAMHVLFEEVLHLMVKTSENSPVVSEKTGNRVCDPW